jgi:hypothetical protein
MPGTLTALDADQIAVYLSDVRAAPLESAAGIRVSSHVQAAINSIRVICSIPFTPLKFTRVQKRILKGCG